VLQATAGARLPYYRGLLAEALGWSGQIDEAMQVLDDAFAGVRKTEEHWWEPELHRLRGELFRRDRYREAESCFQQAAEAARKQDAKLLELRAAVSLARLWRDDGRHADAIRLLTDVHGGCMEGFHTADVRDAESLLQDLRV
jgi:predicted ATPase